MNVVSRFFSQTRAVRERKEKGLHAVDELGRFRILLCCFFLSICVSLTYAFDLFTTQFRDEFGLSAGDLSTVSTVGLVFCYFLIPYSFIYENLGPFVNFWICLVCGVIGTVCLALIFQGYIPGNTATITVFYAFLNTASGLIDTTYVSTLFEVFPRNRGPVVCLAKVMTGLGSSLLACISSSFFPGDIVGFIYFLCALIVVVTSISSFVVVLPPYFMNWWRLRGKTEEVVAELVATKTDYEHKFVPLPRLIIGYVVVICLIIFFTVETPVVAYVATVSRGAKVAIGVIAVVLTMCFFLMLVPLQILGGVNEPATGTGAVRRIEGDVAEKRVGSDSSDAPMSVEKAVTAEVQEMEPIDSLNDDLCNMAASEEEKSEAVSECRQDPRYTGATVWDYLSSADLWLILGYMLCVGPIGILVSYNSSTISIAKTGEKRDEQLSILYVAFLGVGNSVGRLAFGMFEAFVQHQKAGERRFLVTLALFVCPIIGTVGGILILVLPGSAILFPYIIVYILNGFNAALQALIFTCLFDNFHNTLYSLGFMVTVVCVICFNRFMFGMYVDNQHKKLGLPASEECNQAVCIQVPFIVVTIMCAVGAVFAFFVHFRYSRFVARSKQEGLDALDGVEQGVEPVLQDE